MVPGRALSGHTKGFSGSAFSRYSLEAKLFTMVLGRGVGRRDATGCLYPTASQSKSRALSTAPEPRRCGGGVRRGSADLCLSQPRRTRHLAEENLGSDPKSAGEALCASLCLRRRVCIGLRSPYHKVPGAVGRGRVAGDGGGAAGRRAWGPARSGSVSASSAAAAGGMANTALEIIAFVVSISGWLLVSSTVPTDYWKVSTNDGTVITTATFWANLWKTCVTDSTGVSSCKDFPSMLALDGYIQACRGLMITAVSLGFFGSIIALFGMKCTKVGGSEKAKAKIACLAGIIFVLSGLCSMTGCSLYANKITTEFFDPLYVDQKYELGAALFIGWSGASLCIIGGIIFCFSIYESNKTPRMGYAYNGPTSVVSSRTKYHGGGDVKPSNPPRQFDKNAYV